MTYERSYNLLNSKFKELFFPTLLAAIAGNFALIADGLIISALLGHMNLSVIQSIEPLAQFINVVYWLIGFGGTILATSAKANFEDKKANHLFTLSLISIIIISLLNSGNTLHVLFHCFGILRQNRQLCPAAIQGISYGQHIECSV